MYSSWVHERTRAYVRPPMPSIGTSPQSGGKVAHFVGPRRHSRIGSPVISLFDEFSVFANAPIALPRTRART